MINHEGHPVALISARLYQEMKGYGERNHLSFKTVLDRLRAEIHAAA